MLKQLKARYEGLGIARKILNMLMLASIFPILVIDIITCTIVSNTIKNQTDELMESSMKLSQKSLEDYFQVFDQVILSIYAGNDYTADLLKLNTWDAKEYYTAKYKIEKELRNTAYVSPDILGIAVMTLKKEVIFYDSYSYSEQESYCFSSADKEWQRAAESTFSTTQTVYSEPVMKTKPDGTGHHLIYLAHRLTDLNNYSKGTVGSILICLDETSLREVYSQGNQEGMNLSFLMKDNGEIVSCSKDEFIGSSLNISQPLDSEISRLKMVDSSRFILYQKPVLGGKFIQVNLQDTDELMKNVMYIATVVILIGILTVIASCIVVINFAGSVEESVHKIIGAMDLAYKGDYTVQIPCSREDEFGKISKHFNHMVQKIDQSARLEKEALLREKNAEIKALEAQINPHFLYNTLDAINWVAIEQEQFTISKMLKNLAIILRYSIHKSNEVVNVSDELEYLKKYITLQQQRFEYSFQCILNVDEEVLPCKMHKLLFQPLIENAIVHGFPGKSGRDLIRISMYKKDSDHLMIRVEDNGRGMEQKLVEELNEFDYRSNSIESSIGVRNVIMRIKYYYGEEGNVWIESNETGTIVTAQILYE